MLFRVRTLTETLEGYLVGLQSPWWSDNCAGTLGPSRLWLSIIELKKSNWPMANYMAVPLQLWTWSTGNLWKRTDTKAIRSTWNGLYRSNFLLEMGSIEEEEQILKHGPILLIWSDTYESNGLYRSKVVQLERLGGRRTDIKHHPWFLIRLDLCKWLLWKWAVPFQLSTWRRERTKEQILTHRLASLMLVRSPMATTGF